MPATTMGLPLTRLGSREVADQLISLVQEHGALALAIVLMGSCLGLPVPSSLVMMALGSFIEQEGLEALPYFVIGLSGAVVGDQTGYVIGRLSTDQVEQMSRRFGWLNAALARAEAFQSRWSDVGVFLSRWLFSPLGPWINIYAGLTRYSWFRFSIFGILGELLWVAIYLGLGMLFSSSVTALGDILGSLTWFLASAVIAAALGWWLVSIARAR